jgi:hypothetical protein
MSFDFYESGFDAPSEPPNLDYFTFQYDDLISYNVNNSRYMYMNQDNLSVAFIDWKPFRLIKKIVSL